MGARELQMQKLEHQDVLTIESEKIQSVDFAVKGKGFAIITQNNGTITGDYNQMRKLLIEAIKIIDLYFYN